MNTLQVQNLCQKNRAYLQNYLISHTPYESIINFIGKVKKDVTLTSKVHVLYSPYPVLLVLLHRL